MPSSKFKCDGEVKRQPFTKDSQKSLVCIQFKNTGEKTEIINNQPTSHNYTFIKADHHKIQFKSMIKR